MTSFLTLRPHGILDYNNSVAKLKKEATMLVTFLHFIFVLTSFGKVTWARLMKNG